MLQFVESVIYYLTQGLSTLSFSGRESGAGGSVSEQDIYRPRQVETTISSLAMQSLKLPGSSPSNIMFKLGIKSTELRGWHSAHKSLVYSSSSIEGIHKTTRSRGRRIILERGDPGAGPSGGDVEAYQMI